MTRFPALGLLGALALLSACGAQVNDRSGAAYLAARDGQIDPEIAAAAAVEPDLQFPARIGLVRLVYNQVTTAPSDEVAVWDDLIGRTRGFGQFVPVTQSDIGRPTMARLRQAAAGQQIDYLIVTDLNVSRGTGQATFVDVRNGYIYGTAQAASDAGGVNGFWGGRVRNPQRVDQATGRITDALVPEVEDLLDQLADLSAR